MLQQSCRLAEHLDWAHTWVIQARWLYKQLHSLTPQIVESSSSFYMFGRCFEVSKWISFWLRLGALKALCFNSLCRKAGKFCMFVPGWHPSLLPVTMWECYSELPSSPSLLLFSMMCLSCFLCRWCSISPQFFFRRNCTLYMCVCGVSMREGEFRVFLCHQLNLTFHKSPNCAF